MITPMQCARKRVLLMPLHYCEPIKLSGRFVGASPVGYCLHKDNHNTAADIDAFQRAKVSIAATMQQLLVLANISAHNLSESWGIWSTPQFTKYAQIAELTSKHRLFSYHAVWK